MTSAEAKLTITSYQHAEELAGHLIAADEGDQFVRACVETEHGRRYLASEHWKQIQRKLADVAAAANQERDEAAGETWDSYVDWMVQLSTVKMAHEFLCRLQVDELGRAFLGSGVWRRWARARFPEFDPVTGAIGAPPRVPQVGDDVMYVSYGTPGGEFLQEERTARVTAAGAWVEVETTGATQPGPGAMRRVVQVWDPMACALFVMNPTGVFHPGRVEFDDGRLVTDPPSLRVAGELIGGRSYRGGSWHWPRPRTSEYRLQVSVPDEAALRRVAERVRGRAPDGGPQAGAPENGKW